jgi:hypothetical protein
LDEGHRALSSYSRGETSLEGLSPATIVDNDIWLDASSHRECLHRLISGRDTTGVQADIGLGSDGKPVVL